MKKNIFKRTLSAFLAVVMVVLMVPVATFVATAETPDYSVPTTGHMLLSAYNALSGTDISADHADITSSLEIFNREKLDTLFKNYSSYTYRHAQSGREYRGSDMEAFSGSAGVSISHSIGVNIGIEKIFKASVEQKFKATGDFAYNTATETYFYEYAVRRIFSCA